MAPSATSRRGRVERMSQASATSAGMEFGLRPGSAREQLEVAWVGALEFPDVAFERRISFLQLNVLICAVR